MTLNEATDQINVTPQDRARLELIRRVHEFETLEEAAAYLIRTESERIWREAIE